MFHNPCSISFFAQDTQDRRLRNKNPNHVILDSVTKWICPYYDIGKPYCRLFPNYYSSTRNHMDLPVPYRQTILPLFPEFLFFNEKSFKISRRQDTLYQFWSKGLSYKMYLRIYTIANHIVTYSQIFISTSE